MTPELLFRAHGEAGVTVPILQLRKQGFREVRSLVQEHKVEKLQIQPPPPNPLPFSPYQATTTGALPLRGACGPAAWASADRGHRRRAWALVKPTPASQQDGREHSPWEKRPWVTRETEAGNSPSSLLLPPPPQCGDRVGGRGASPRPAAWEVGTRVRPRSPTTLKRMVWPGRGNTSSCMPLIPQSELCRRPRRPGSGCGRCPSPRAATSSSSNATQPSQTMAEALVIRYTTATMTIPTHSWPGDAQALYGGGGDWKLLGAKGAHLEEPGHQGLW